MRTKCHNADILEHVREAGDERIIGSDYSVIYFLFPGKANDPIQIRRFNRDAHGITCYPSVAGQCVELIYLGIVFYFFYYRMLTASAANHHYFHLQAPFVSVMKKPHACKCS